MLLTRKIENCNSMINYDAVKILLKDNLIFAQLLDNLYPMTAHFYVLTFYGKTVKFPAASNI